MFDRIILHTCGRYEALKCNSCGTQHNKWTEGSRASPGLRSQHRDLQLHKYPGMHPNSRSSTSTTMATIMIMIITT